ncbi:unnamed protein product [Ectocarpus sp. 12 AP-2014]
MKGLTLSVVYGTEQPRGETLGRQQDPLWTTGGRSVLLIFNGNNHSTWRSASYRGKKSNLLEPALRLTRLTSFMARASTIKSYPYLSMPLLLETRNLGKNERPRNHLGYKYD